jgi:hypothetical protein
VPIGSGLIGEDDGGIPDHEFSMVQAGAEFQFPGIRFRFKRAEFHPAVELITGFTGGLLPGATGHRKQ